MSEWTAVDSHFYRFEDDVFFWRPCGEVRGEHAQLVCQCLEQILKRCGYALWLVDAAGSVALGYEARRVYARWFAEQPRRIAIGTFKSPTAASTTAGLLLRGIQIVGGREVPLNLSEDEATARRYLEKKRAQLAAEKH